MKSTTDLIQEYKELFDEGVLTLDEYNYLKKHLLDLGDFEFQEEENILDKSSRRIDEEYRSIKKVERNEMMGCIGAIACFVLLIIFAVFIFRGCVDYLGDTDSPDYETYYEDDNGNGELDPGEWNYTVDEDGDVVDIDNDLNNFE